MRYYERLKKKKVDVSYYSGKMKDPNNVIEIENLETNFFTDNGTVKSVNGVSFSIPKAKLSVLSVNLVAVRVLLLFQLCN